MRLLLGESAAKVITGMPLAVAALIGSMNESGSIGCTQIPAGFFNMTWLKTASSLLMSYSGVPV